MNYKNIIKIALILFTISFATTSIAQCPTSNNKNKTDIAKSTAETAATNQQEVLNNQEKEKQRTAKTGNASCSNKPSSSKEIKTGAYNYLKKNILEKKLSSQHINYQGSSIDQGTIKFKQAVNIIKDNFFEKGKKEESTPQTINEIKKRRIAYVDEVSKVAVKTSAELKDIVQEDNKSINEANTTGCNQGQAPILQNRNLAALVKATAADIIIQVLTMEAEAATAMISEPINTISFTPEEIELLKSVQNSSNGGKK